MNYSINIFKTFERLLIRFWIADLCGLWFGCFSGMALEMANELDIKIFRINKRKSIKMD